jgi:hypothetical protein
MISALMNQVKPFNLLNQPFVTRDSVFYRAAVKVKGKFNIKKLIQVGRS